MNTKKVTSFTAHQTAEGMRVAFTYSIIDENGNVIKSNARASIILMDSDMINYVDNLNNYLYSKIPE